MRNDESKTASSSFLIPRSSLQCHSSQARDVLARPQLQQALDGRLDEVDRVRAAMHLGQDVANAAALQHVAHARSRLDARTRTGRHQNDVAAAELSDDAMRNRLAAHLNF